MSEEKKHQVISEAAHWYDKDGSPMPDTVHKADGVEHRTFTLRDARKYGACPSVSAICYFGEDNTGIQNWDRNLLISAITDSANAALDIDPRSRITPELIEEALKDYRTARDQSSTTGTEIHAAIQRAIQGKSMKKVHAPFKVHVANVLEWLGAFGLAHQLIEKAFCNIEYGCGGTLDYVGKTPDGGLVCCDWKSVGPKSFKGFRPKPAHVKQLAAYGFLNDMPVADRYVVGICQETGAIKPCILEQDVVEWGWCSFRANLGAWKWDRKYFPDCLDESERWTAEEVKIGKRKS